MFSHCYFYWKKICAFKFAAFVFKVMSAMLSAEYELHTGSALNSLFLHANDWLNEIGKKLRDVIQQIGMKRHVALVAPCTLHLMMRFKNDIASELS